MQTTIQNIEKLECGEVGLLKYNGDDFKKLLRMNLEKRIRILGLTFDFDHSLYKNNLDVSKFHRSLNKSKNWSSVEKSLNDFYRSLDFELSDDERKTVSLAIESTVSGTGNCYFWGNMVAPDAIIVIRPLIQNNQDSNLISWVWKRPNKIPRAEFLHEVRELIMSQEHGTSVCYIMF